MSAKYLNASGPNQPFKPNAYLRFPLKRQPVAKDLWMLLLTDAEAEQWFDGTFSQSASGAALAPTLVEFPEAHEDFLL